MIHAPCEQHRPGPAARTAARLGGRIPVLDTRRLQLRGPRIYDFGAYASILCSDRAAHMGGPFTRAAAWGRFTESTACWLLHGHGLWTIDAVNTPSAGFAVLGFDHGDMEPALCVCLTANAEGQGLATEALTAARGHAFDTLGWDSVRSCVAPANTRGVAMMDRIGVARDTTAESALADGTLVYRHMREAA